VRFGTRGPGEDNKKPHFTRDIIKIDWYTQQINSELEQFQMLIADSPIERVIEIGSAGGGTTALWALIGTQVISVDLGLPEKCYKGDTEIENKVVNVIGNSRDDRTIEEVRRVLDGKKVDLLFIDGDHTYLGAELDFLNYKQFVEDYGIIAFHDISRLIPDLWEHIRSQSLIAWEIRHVPELRHNGIGVIRYDSKVVYRIK